MNEWRASQVRTSEDPGEASSLLYSTLLYPLIFAGESGLLSPPGMNPAKYSTYLCTPPRERPRKLPTRAKLDRSDSRLRVHTYVYAMPMHIHRQWREKKAKVLYSLKLPLWMFWVSLISISNINTNISISIRNMNFTLTLP